jgi:hypothetical protein
LRSNINFAALPLADSNPTGPAHDSTQHRVMTKNKLNLCFIILGFIFIDFNLYPTPPSEEKTPLGEIKTKRYAHKFIHFYIKTPTP